MLQPGDVQFYTVTTERVADLDLLDRGDMADSPVISSSSVGTLKA